ncbi:MAG: hypothetical protein LBD67_00440 [Candidatus Accumulibacter sp.]|nr:hypothetical protein [Accumulibacter sp.]
MLSLSNHRQCLSPFVLSLSKYERTLKGVSDLFNPWLLTAPVSVRTERVKPSTMLISVRAEPVEAGTDAPGC